MSDSLFLPRELFTAPASAASKRATVPSHAVLDDLRRIATPVATPAAPGTTNAYALKNRRRQPRDPNAPRVDLWLDITARAAASESVRPATPRASRRAASPSAPTAPRACPAPLRCSA